MGRRERDAEASEYLASALPRLGRLAGGITGSWIDAEDLAQETAAKVMVKWRQVQASENPDAYVRQMMMNIWLSQRRRRSATEVISHETAAAALAAAPPGQDGVDAQQSVLDLLRHLPRQQRAVLALRYLEDLPDPEIAEILDCSVSAVGSAAHRGLAALRRAHGSTLKNSASPRDGAGAPPRHTDEGVRRW